MHVLRALPPVPGGRKRHICQNLRIIGIDQTERSVGVREDSGDNTGSSTRRFPNITGDSRSAGECRAYGAGRAGGGADGLDYRLRPIGLMCIAVARLRELNGFATETNEQRRAMARKWADVVLNPRRRCGWKNSGGNEWHGVDALLEMSGIRRRFSRRLMLRAAGALRCWDSDGKMCRWIGERRDFKGATVQGIYGRRMYETWVQMRRC